MERAGTLIVVFDLAGGCSSKVARSVSITVRQAAPYSGGGSVKSTGSWWALK